jgi:hypothetical protein
MWKKVKITAPYCRCTVDRFWYKRIVFLGGFRWGVNISPCYSTFVYLIKVKWTHYTLLKIKFSSYIRKFIMEQLQSHIWLTTSAYIVKSLHISSYMRKPFLTCDSEFPHIWGKFYFLFYQCTHLNVKNAVDGFNDPVALDKLPLAQVQVHPT